MNTIPTIDDIRRAAERIRPYVHRTPVMTCESLNHMAGAFLFFKCENFQKAGAFKMRGAANAVFSLPDDAAARGVATHSSGNHAAALSLAATLRGIEAYIVMPENSPGVKKAAVEGYGGRITFCEPTLQAREDTLADVVDRTGAIFIPPYNHPDIIAGQGTAALELIEDTPVLDAIIAPVGGGGLMSGTAITAQSLSPGIMVYGAEPEMADDAYRSFKTGVLQPSVNPATVADGLKTSLGEITFEIIKHHVDEIATVSEEAIIRAMRLIWERMKIIVEPSCAVPLAALLERKLDVRGKKVGIILSGGNVDLDRLPWLGQQAAG
ncbi:MAG: pyridoxal-phosphate dependent enzyme [Rhodothermaceae bacterium]|nr:pyridoxal-phosphate dependent enzyme [Rhodothermaceae bacterium]